MGVFGLVFGWFLFGWFFVGFVWFLVGFLGGECVVAIVAFLDVLLMLVGGCC